MDLFQRRACLQDLHFGKLAADNSCKQLSPSCCRRSVVTGGGRSNWLSGAQLVAAYVLVACVYFFRDSE